MMDVHQVINELQDRNLLGALRHRSGDNLMFSCPFVENHGGKVYQKTPSFGIREVDASGRPAGAWNCFVCHAGSKNLVELWAQLTGQTVEESKEVLSDAEVRIETILSAVRSLDEKIDLAPQLLTGWPATTPIADCPLARDYLLGRGIGPELWELAGLEWFGGKSMPPRKDKEESSVRGERIIFPLWWEGKRVGYSSRAAGYETDLKYYRPVLNMNTLLYDPSGVLQQNGDLIFVVEGEMDCLACIREGLPAVSSFGSSITRHQAKVLQKFKQVVFIYDNDKAGIRGVARISELYGGSLRWRAMWLPEGKDAASMAPGWGKSVLDLASKPAPDLVVNSLLQALKGV